MSLTATPMESPESDEARRLIEDFHTSLKGIREQVRKIIVGQDEVVEHLLLQEKGKLIGGIGQG